MINHKNIIFILGLMPALLESAKAQELNRNSDDYPFIKYYSENCQSNPFDDNAIENFFFYDGNYSCLSNERSDFKTFYERSKTYVVFEFERLDLVQNGNLLQHFKEVEVLTKSLVVKNKQYVILSSKKVFYYIHNGSETIAVQSYEINRPDTSFGALNAFVWDDYIACLAYAKKYSADTENRLLVAKVISIYDTH